MNNPTPPRVLEVCVETRDDLEAALAGGADRIELNRDLAQDGLTPGAGAVSWARARTELPLIVMIRPHHRGFVYSAQEVHAMVEAMATLSALGVDGYAVGPLTAEGTVDASALKTLVAAAAGLDVVYHRAFDHVADRSRGLETLIDHGVVRVLTSGGAPSAVEGVHRIADLVVRAAERIEILPGGGITPSNADAILRGTGCTQLHGTFRLGGMCTDAAAVAQVRQLLHA
ncbi:MAG: copper homeostasis protein CutC [Gemmatimonadota bacterium]